MIDVIAEKREFPAAHRPAGRRSGFPVGPIAISTSSLKLAEDALVGGGYGSRLGERVR